jgi:hypothetical protein
MKLVIFLVMGIFLIGCVSPQIIGTSQIGDTSTVTIKYLPVPGLSSVTEGRRNDAISQAKEHCGGLVKILSETETPEVQLGAMVGSFAVPLSQRYMYLQFECLDKRITAEVY